MKKRSWECEHEELQELRFNEVENYGRVNPTRWRGDGGYYLHISDTPISIDNGEFSLASNEAPTILGPENLGEAANVALKQSLHGGDI